MILKILLYIEAYFIIGIIAMYAGSKHASRDEKRGRWIKLIVYFFIVHSTLAIILVEAPYFIILTALVLLIGLFEVIHTFYKYSVKHAQKEQIKRISAIYIITAIGMTFFSMETGMEIILYVYLIVGVFDGYSQLTGQLFGKHALAKKISPNKTIEGSIGGLIIALLSGILLRSFPMFSMAEALGFTVVICIGGLFGDLMASYVKRLYQIKDFNKIIPGHGGFLDRFDSFIGAGALYQVIIWLL